MNRNLGSLSVSGQLPTYPSPNPTLTPDCCWVRGGVSGQLPRYWYWSEISCLWLKKVSQYILGLSFTRIGWMNFIDHTSWGTTYEGLRSIYEKFQSDCAPQPTLTKHYLSHMQRKVNNHDNSNYEGHKLIKRITTDIFPCKAPYHSFWLILMLWFPGVMYLGSKNLSSDGNHTSKCQDQEMT